MMRDGPARPWTIGRAVRVMQRWPLRFASAVILAIACGTLWVGGQEPEYRARVTMLLSPGPSPAAMARASIAGIDLSGEIAVMRSHEVLSAIVSRPHESEPAGEYVRLGLTTITDDVSARPIPSMIRRLTRKKIPAGSLRVDGTDGLKIASVEFLAPARVRIALPSNFGTVSDSVEMDLIPGDPIALKDGQQIRLWPEGDLTGRMFHIQTRPRTDAINALRSQISIDREGRGTRVAYVNVRDSDPHRAATIANALAHNYLEVTRQRALRKSSSTIRFIEEELATQREGLDEASKALAEIQSELPDATVPEATTSALLQQVRRLEQERLRLAGAEQSFKEALELIDAGDASGLARLDPRFLDLSSQRYLGHLAELNTESAVQGQSKPGSYRYALRSRVTELQDEDDKIQGELASIQAILDSHDGGDPEAFSRLVTPGRITLPPDPMTSVLISELGRLRSMRDEKISAFTDKHPSVIAARESVEAVKERLSTHLRSRLLVHEQALGRVRSLTTKRQELVDTLPEDERAAIEVAIRELSAVTHEHITGRLAAISSERESMDAEIARVESDLEKLPSEARRVAFPMMDVAAQQAMVQYLTKNLQEARVATSTPNQSSEVVDPADPPNSREKPNAMLALLIAAILGSVGGLLYADWCENVQGQIHTVEELEATTGLPCLATLHGELTDPRTRAASHNAPAAWEPHSDSTSWEDDTAIRFLRTVLLSASGEAKRADVGRVVMITSSEFGEGRTEASDRLSQVCSNAGDKTLLVHLDRSSNDIHDDTVGLAQVISGEVSCSDVIQTNPGSSVDLISSGGAHGSLLTPETLQTLLAELTREYGVVIVRLPPVQATPEAPALLPIADGVLLVARAGATPRSTVERAAIRIRAASGGTNGAALMTFTTAPAHAPENSHAFS